MVSAVKLTSFLPALASALAHTQAQGQTSGPGRLGWGAGGGVLCPRRPGPVCLGHCSHQRLRSTASLPSSTLSGPPGLGLGGRRSAGQREPAVPQL